MSSIKRNRTNSQEDHRHLCQGLFLLLYFLLEFCALFLLRSFKRFIRCCLYQLSLDSLLEAVSVEMQRFLFLFLVLHLGHSLGEEFKAF